MQSEITLDYSYTASDLVEIAVLRSLKFPELLLC